MFRPLILLLAILGLSLPLAAQELKFEANSDKTEYASNERIRITFSLNGIGTGLVAPSFDGLVLISGPSTSTSMTYINGETTNTSTHSYMLKPKQPGTFTIGAARITVDGKELMSEPIQVKVNTTRIESIPNTIATGQSGDTAFVRIELNHSQIGTEDVAIAKYMLFSTYERIEHINEMSIPIPDDAWWVDVSGDLALLQEGKKTIDGKSYSVYLLKTITIQPLRSGTIRLEPVAMNLTVRVKKKSEPGTNSSAFSDFFGDHISKDVSITSEPTTLSVTEAAHDNMHELSREDLMDLMGREYRDRSDEPGGQVIFLVDVSASMCCKDILPDRLKATKVFLQALIKHNMGDMIGVLPFSHTALDVDAETSDMIAVSKKIEELDYDQHSKGTSIGMALYMAVKRLNNRQGKSSVLLISDGNSNVGNVSIMTMAHLAKKFNIRVDVIGLGKTGSALCATDSVGQIVFTESETVVNEPLLRSIAETTGGAYFHAIDKTQLKSLVGVMEKRMFQER